MDDMMGGGLLTPIVPWPTRVNREDEELVLWRLSMASKKGS